jgi:hypothetical protein
MHDEYSRLALLANHFSVINKIIYLFLKEDRHAEKVRAAFWPFNEHMDLATTEFRKGLWRAYGFHISHKWNPSQVLDEPALIFLDSEFQAELIKYAHEASSHFSTAAQIIQEKVLPLLPDMREKLGTFVDGYSTRKRITEARAKSWIPSLAQDLIWGRTDKITRNISDIEALPKDLRAAEPLLHKLPAILERLSTHFLQLSRLKGRDLDAMGYSSLDALRSLLKDRTVCLSLIDSMTILWMPSSMAFGMVKFLVSKNHP